MCKVDLSKPSIHEIMLAVSAITNIPVDRLLSDKKHKPLVSARSLVVVVAREFGHGCTFIARAMSRDHTTVFYAYRQAAHRVKLEPQYAARVRAVRDKAMDLRAQRPLRAAVQIAGHPLLAAGVAVPVSRSARKPIDTPPLKLENPKPVLPPRPVPRGRMRDCIDVVQGAWFQANDDAFVAAMAKAHPELLLKQLEAAE